MTMYLAVILRRRTGNMCLSADCSAAGRTRMNSGCGFLADQTKRDENARPWRAAMPLPIPDSPGDPARRREG